MSRNFFSVPEFEAGVRKRSPFDDDLSSNSSLNLGGHENSRSTSESDRLDELGARKSTSILVASCSSNSDGGSRSKEEGSLLKLSHGNLAVPVTGFSAKSSL